MCGEHLPSTLVKMLYLFMDLPDLSKDSQNVEMISKMLMSVLIRSVLFISYTLVYFKLLMYHYSVSCHKFNIQIQIQMFRCSYI